jgi:hypothetical protein
MTRSESEEKEAFLMRKNKKIPDKGGIGEQYDGIVRNHPDYTSHSIPSTPCSFGKAAVIAQFLRHTGVLTKMAERVHFAGRLSDALMEITFFCEAKISPMK